MANILPRDQRRCIIHNELLPCPDCGHAGAPPLTKIEEEAPRAGIAGIFDAIIKEREFQDRKYGPVLIIGKDFGALGAEVPTQGPGGHELGAWLIIAESELAEAKKALVHGGSKNTNGRDTIRAELVQLAAVCVAALQQHGLREEEPERAGSIRYVDPGSLP